MGDVGKYNFPSLIPTVPLTLVHLTDLTRALTTQRLQGRICSEAPSRMARIASPLRFVSVRRPQHPIIRRAKMWAENQILDDLQKGTLVAYVPSGESAGFRAIPSDFWRDAYSGLSIGGKLLDFPHRAAVPEEIIGSTIFVFDELAFRWLMKRKINEDNPDYPRSLRKPRRLPGTKIPSDMEIRAKMLSLMSDGYTMHEAAKRIGLLPGFRGVENAHARRAMEGLDFKPGRRPKKPR